MMRHCFLCQHETELLYASDWALPGLPLTNIGFSICPQCGAVCQSPTVSFEDMLKFYSSIAVYTNPGRDERPSPSKMRDVDEQIQFIKRGIGRLPCSALQIGSSDGYTLAQFKDAGVTQVMGIEPGAAAVALAQKRYGIRCQQSTAEHFEVAEPYELILLTHVLEHLYTPQQTLAKCQQLQASLAEGFIYVEVPLLAAPHSLCPGFFSFEHINYYTRELLLQSLLQVGYYPVSIIEHYNSNLSPIVGVLASTKAQHHVMPMDNQYCLNKQRMLSYRHQETQYWQQKLTFIKPQLIQAKRLFLWGAGIHTCQLLANTDLLQNFHITGLTDSAPQKWGIQQGDWQCQAPDSISWQAGDCVLISSYASELEIYRHLQYLRDKQVNTVMFHRAVNEKDHLVAVNH